MGEDRRYQFVDFKLDGYQPGPPRRLRALDVAITIIMVGLLVAAIVGAGWLT